MTRAQKKAQATISLDGESGSLQERALLVSLGFHFWRDRRADRTATAETTKHFKMDARMGTFHKRLLAGEAMQRLTAASNGMNRVHHKWTLPWDDQGGRILAGAAYFDYTKEMAEARDEFEAAKTEFGEKYEEYYKDAKEKLGDRFDKSEYPALSVILSRFQAIVTFSPVPASADFRVNLGKGDLSAVKAGLESDLKTRFETAMRDPWLRLHEVCAHLLERAKSFTVTEEKGGGNQFRDSVVENVQKVLDLLPVLNITGDETLTKAAAVIKQKLVKNPGAVRDDEKVRAQTVKDAAAIVKRLADFI